MNKKKLLTLLLSIVGLITLSFIVMDWLVFYQCGAVEQCLVESSDYQNISKFVVTTLMMITVLCIGKDCICPRDRKFLQAAFIVTFFADLCFKIFHNYFSLVEYRGDFTLMGISCFMVVQTLFTYRHTRLDDTDTHTPWSLAIPFGMIFVANFLHVFRIFEDVTLPLVLVYATFLITSMVVACMAPKKGYFPAKNAWYIKVGMIIFFLGDVCVGASLATGADHSVQEIAATVANNFVWFFYVPALALIALSGYKFSKN